MMRLKKNAQRSFPAMAVVLTALLCRERSVLADNTTYVYDVANPSQITQVTSIETLDPVTSTVYDSVGNAIALTDSGPNSSTTNVYDASGNVVQTIDTLGPVTSTTYDTLGNP
ncbi:MAG: RHS repeat protein, partial [Phycisphaerae bacterium]|nr:RHS repeat protein [Phycisphaerae bacterium]